tara:strand:- start:467 stop:1120 length:654 start_codon:yes stop_codon:yes gene_type:complete
MSKFTLYDYDSSKFPFKETVQKMMDVDQLDMIHEIFEFPEKLEIIKDQNTILHDKFYEEMKKDEFTSLYRDFVSNFVSNLEIFRDEQILYQTYPSFRIHQPNNIAVGQYHKDSDFGHNTHEMNFWLPFTNAWDTNSVWIGDPDSDDHVCMEVNYGQVANFDGANSLHGNKDNLTGKSRLSIDFRIFPLKFYNQQEQEQTQTLTQKKKFVIGEYWSEL